MAVDAYLLPYLGHSAGVVFWEPRPRRPARAGTGALSDERRFAVYAPEPLSPGEAAQLQAYYVASLGEGLSERPAARAALLWWWCGGLGALLLLAGRALEFGPAYAWLALAAAATALPFGAGAPVWPFASRRASVAHRLARRVAQLEPVSGADARSRERISAIWRLARRLDGAVADQLRALEAHCRDQAWPQAADFYAQEWQARQQPLHSSGKAGELRRRRLFARRGAGAGFYCALEMRAW